MKLETTVLKVVAVAGVAAAIVAGCSTPTIPVTMNVAGEIKLNGVSKIAIADFNSLPGDPFTGVMAADAETCALVKRAVAASFYASPMYQIVDMDVEKDIHDEHGANPSKRFDALIYGRLWWSVTPEIEGKYPRIYTLRSWENEPIYKNGKKIRVNEVTTQTKDVLQMLDYKVRNATLMLTLSAYRLEKSGDVVKLSDTYQVSNQGFTLMNGQVKLDSGLVGLKDDSAVARLKATGKDEKVTSAYEEMFGRPADSVAAVGGAAAAAVGGFGSMLSNPLASAKEEAPVKEVKTAAKRDANGKLILTQQTVSMPTDLQAKLMLADSISRGLSAKLAPTKQTFDVEADLGDARLVNLLKNGAFASVREYSLYMLRTKMGKQICEKLVKFLPEFAEPCTYPVPDSTAKFEDYNEALIDELLKANFDLYFYTLGIAHDAAAALEGSARYNDKMLGYLAGEDLDIYFYALGIYNEARQNLDAAGEYYKFAFNVNPSKAYALGISRVYLAMGQDALLKQTQKAKNKASKSSKLN